MKKFLGRLMPSVSDVCSAAVGAVFTAAMAQFAFPAVAPYLDLWSYRYIGWNMTNPKFAVVASESQVRGTTEPGDLLTFHRMFCGWSSTCISKSVVFNRETTPASWGIEVDEDGEDVTTMAVMVRSFGSELTAAFIRLESNRAGFFQMDRRPPASYSGYGFSCYTIGTNTQRYFGRYYAYWGGLNGILTEVRKTSNGVVDEATVDAKFREIFLAVPSLPSTPDTPSVECAKDKKPKR